MKSHAIISRKLRAKAKLPVKHVTPETIQTDFEADNLTPEVGEQVQFTDESSLSPSKWLWSLGDDNYSEQQNPSIAYQSTGKKTVTLHAGGTSDDAKDAGNVEDKVDYIEVVQEAFITEAFIATTGDILNSSGQEASSGDSIETVEGQEEPTLNRDLSQNTSSNQPQGAEVNGVLALQGDGNDDFMRFDNVTRQEWEDLIAQGTFAVSFMTNPDSDTSGEGEFGYRESTSLNRLEVLNNQANGGVEEISIFDSNGNFKRYNTAIDLRGSVNAMTAVFKEIGDFEIIINGTDEAVLNQDQSPDFSQLDLSNNAEGPLYLNVSGIAAPIDFPVSKEFFVHDANSVSQGHHMDAHNFLRNLYNV